MLSFTPEVEAALAWFESTHELVNADGRFWWRSLGWPGPGSLGEQDARLSLSIEYLRRIHDDLVTRERTEADGI